METRQLVAAAKRGLPQMGLKSKSGFHSNHSKTGFIHSNQKREKSSALFRILRKLFFVPLVRGHGTRKEIEKRKRLEQSLASSDSFSSFIPQRSKTRQTSWKQARIQPIPKILQNNLAQSSSQTMIPKEYSSLEKQK
jgi:hypothetical protein